MLNYANYECLTLDIGNDFKIIVMKVVVLSYRKKIKIKI